MGREVQRAGLVARLESLQLPLPLSNLMNQPDNIVVVVEIAHCHFLHLPLALALEWWNRRLPCQPSPIQDTVARTTKYRCLCDDNNAYKGRCAHHIRHCGLTLGQGVRETKPQNSACKLIRTRFRLLMFCRGLFFVFVFAVFAALPWSMLRK